MNGRENWEALLAHEPTDGVPNIMDGSVIFGGCEAEYWENGPITGGLDAFGNGWVPTSSTNGAAALDPSIIPLDDVCDWEDKVTFPDLDTIDWKAYVEQQWGGANRRDNYFEYHTYNSVFLRLTHLLGFENALCAFYEEPEATKALCDAIADYKIRLLGYVDKYIHPDAYVHYDDFATMRDLFISPETYREFIKPAHIRMNEAAISFGMVPEIHICGRCESVIPDVIEEGSAAWQSAQPMNDIAGILRDHGDQLAIIGGYDTQGVVGTPKATDEEIVAEVDRCMDEYAGFGRSFAFTGWIMGSADDDENIVNHKIEVLLGRFDERNAELKVLQA